MNIFLNDYSNIIIMENVLMKVEKNIAQLFKWKYVGVKRLR